MNFTIGKKLISSFLLLACLVLLSGIVGIYVLNKVAGSTDTVIKEKLPVQTSIFKSAAAIETAQKDILTYIHTSSGLDTIRKKVFEKLDEFEMWMAMVRHGTASETFKKSKSYKTYKALKMDLHIPKASDAMLAQIGKAEKEAALFRQSSLDLMTAHDNYLKYAYTVGNKTYSLPSYITMMKLYNNNWFKVLESSAVAVTKFERNTDPVKGMIGTWIQTYSLDDKNLNKLIKSLDKYNKKLMTYAVKINEEKTFEGKNRYLKRNTGNSNRVNRFLDQINQYIEPIYKEIDQTKDDRNRTLEQSVLKINQGLEQLIKGAEKEMGAARTKADSAKKTGVSFLITLTIIAVVIAGVLGLFMSRYLTASITALATVTKQVASGDLKNKVKVSSKDELGRLADDTNTMTDNLKRIIHQITDFSKQLIDSSSDLSGLASALSEGADGMARRTESVSAAAEEMSTNMSSVAAASEQTSVNINTVSIATDEINSSISEIAKNAGTGNSITQEAVGKAETATKRVQELGSAAREISKVTEVISEISEQTNLLALNATIEAARAGEAGKGFAVVASEIKQLAIQTTEATNDIKERIEKIQNSTSHTAGEIEGVARIIGNINEIVSTIAAAVEEQSATTTEISENMTQASTGLQDVTDKVSQSNQVSSEIAKDISEVNISSNEVLSNSEQVNTRSKELEKLAKNLQEIVNQFKL